MNIEQASPAALLTDSEIYELLMAYGDVYYSAGPSEIEARRARVAEILTGSAVTVDVCGSPCEDRFSYYPAGDPAVLSYGNYQEIPAAKRRHGVFVARTVLAIDSKRLVVSRYPVGEEPGDTRGVRAPCGYGFCINRTDLTSVILHR